MKTLLNKWFIIACTVWLIVIVLRRLGHPFPLNGSINDLMAIPVIATLSLWFQRVIIIRNNYYVLSVWHVVFITIYVTLIFEGLLPLFSKVYTADFADVVLYIAGAVFFYRVMNKPVAETRNIE